MQLLLPRSLDALAAATALQLGMVLGRGEDALGDQAEALPVCELGACGRGAVEAVEDAQ